MLAAPRGLLFSLLAEVRNDNAKQEYYLTDVVGLARGRGQTVRAVFAPETSVMGVNSQAELAEAEAAFQQQVRRRLLDNGVTMPAPDTVMFSHDTEIAPGAVIEPYVVFGAGVVVGQATIRAFSHLEGARVADRAIIGPYARLRPGADIGEAAHIGKFVEVKAVTVVAGAKAISVMARWGPAPISARVRSSATMTASTSTGRRWGPGPSSAPTAPWWRR